MKVCRDYLWDHDNVLYLLFPPVRHTMLQNINKMLLTIFSLIVFSLCLFLPFSLTAWF